MQSFCGSQKRTNVAKFGCDEARAYPKKLGIGGKAFTPSNAQDEATFLAALMAATKLDSGNADKLFFINGIEDPNDTSTQNTKGKVGEGVEQVLVEGKQSFTYRVEIGQDLFKRLRKFNKRRVAIFTYDDAGNLWGCKNADGNFVGCEAIFFISGNTQQTSAAPTSALIEISYVSSTQYNDDAYYVPVQLSEFEPAGLLDVELRVISSASNVFKVAVETKVAQFGKVLNMSEKYNSQLVAGLYNAKTGVAFATNLAITSRAYDSSLKCETITFDSTAFGLLSTGDLIKLYLDPVADLTTAGITGLEGVELIFAKP